MKDRRTRTVDALYIIHNKSEQGIGVSGVLRSPSESVINEIKLEQVNNEMLTSTTIIILRNATRGNSCQLHRC